MAAAAALATIKTYIRECTESERKRKKKFKITTYLKLAISETNVAWKNHFTMSQRSSEQLQSGKNKRKEARERKNEHNSISRMESTKLEIFPHVSIMCVCVCASECKWFSCSLFYVCCSFSQAFAIKPCYRFFGQNEKYVQQQTQWISLFFVSPQSPPLAFRQWARIYIHKTHSLVLFLCVYCVCLITSLFREIFGNWHPWQLAKETKSERAPQKSETKRIFGWP